MYKKIMVPLDGSEMAECVLPHVEAIGRGCGTETVVLVRVEEPMETPASAKIRFSEEDIHAFEADRTAIAGEYLREVARRIRFDWTRLETKVLSGPVSEQIVECARDEAVDLIVIATHGRSGIGRWVWGSTADRILRSSCTPVFMVRAPGCVPGFD